MIIPLSGFLAGALHVWSGPDHLAAVAPLSLTSRSRPWLAGLRWGIGHSAGVGIVALLASLLKSRIHIESLSAAGENLVGFMLIAIGLWSLRGAFRLRVSRHEHPQDGEAFTHTHAHAHGHAERGSGHVAIGVGMLHGLAGTSHFLGILPALALPSPGLAALYIAGFLLGTIVSMAVFAALLGSAATRLGDRAPSLHRRLLFASGGAAILVGIAWISGFGF